jgi:hypothetical protein
MANYTIGDVAVRTIIFKDANGNSVVPTAVTATVTNPSGVSTVYTYPSGSLTSPLSGKYQVTFPITLEGTWLLQWAGTGANAATESEYLWASQINLATPTLLPLIARLRTMVNDTAGTAQVFTDVDLENKLREQEIPQVMLPVFFEPISQPGTTYLYTVGQIQTIGWCVPGTTGGTIMDSAGSVFTGWSLTIDGRITFAANQGGSLRYFTGYSYDLYAAAARTLEDWASRTMLEFDFVTDQQDFKRSQKSKQLIAQADRYWSQALPRMVSQIRHDTWPLGRTLHNNSVPRNGGRFSSPNYW